MTLHHAAFGSLANQRLRSTAMSYLIVVLFCEAAAHELSHTENVKDRLFSAKAAFCLDMTPRIFKYNDGAVSASRALNLS